MGGFTCFTAGVAPRSRGVRGNVWARLFLSSFEVLYVDITFTKEFGAPIRAGAAGTAGPVLAGPVFLPQI